MGGRGRGRGGAMAFHAEQLGFGRGEGLPTATGQPPPLFPMTDNQPLPLDSNEKYEYLLELKRDYRTNMEDSPYYLKPEAKKTIDRYSDRYKTTNQNGTSSIGIAWSIMPVELRPKKKSKTKTSSSKSKKAEVNLLNKIEHLEKKEKEGEGTVESAEDSDAEQKKSDEDAAVDDDVEVSDEEMEEDNDYIQEYFDNGERFGDDEDDGLDDGPVY